jgi:periplasmic protein TonB
MFNALETTWDQSARRRWTTVASFTMQAVGVSLLLALPMLWVQGPPQLRWFDSRILVPPSAPPAPTPPGAQRPIRSSNMSGDRVIAPTTVPHDIAPIDDRNSAAPAAPAFGDFVVPGGIGRHGLGVPGALGDQMAIAPPPVPVSTHPLRVSHWAEGNLIYRVQPSYPLLARQARIQGPVQLRAIISRTGTIENLAVLLGHPMLSTAAVEAVRQWRYRPYLLNGEPIEVETEITVNFVLSGN